MRATPIEPLQTVERAGFRITPVPVSHSGDTLGMIVDNGSSCVAFAADTGPTDQIWQELATRPTLTAVFLECSFPNSMEDLATKTGHLCPRTFATQRARLPDRVKVFAVHRKARYADEIARELSILGLPNVEPVTPGLPYDL
jgi:ribonuclease BN (tRNA processing enzyme)